MPCNDNLVLGYFTCEEGASAGISDLWIFQHTGSTVWSAGTNGQIVSANAVPTMYKVKLQEGTCNLKHDLVINEQYGNKSYAQRMSFVLIGHSLSAVTFANTIDSTAIGMVVKHEEGVYSILGTSKPCKVKAVAADTGTQFQDANIITMTYGAQVNDIAPQLGSALIAALPTS